MIERKINLTVGDTVEEVYVRFDASVYDKDELEIEESSIEVFLNDDILELTDAQHAEVVETLNGEYRSIMSEIIQDAWDSIAEDRYYQNID
jgi:hypothetical protein